MEETFDFQYKLFGSSKSSRPGSHKSSERGSGMEFNRLVSLQQYPDPRRLDLRASIIDPYERWLVREFKQRSAVSVFAIVDLSASVRFNGLQNGKALIIKILTSVMNSTRRYGDRFGLIGFDNKFRKDWFMPATQRIPVNFDTLNLQFSSGKAERGHKGLMEAPNWLPKERCLIFFISDFHFSLNLLSYFFSRTIPHQVVPIILEDEVEHSGYDRFGFAFLSDSETRRKKLVLLTKKFKDSLKENYRKRDQQLLTICRQFNSMPVKILGDFDPKVLTEHFFGY